MLNATKWDQREKARTGTTDGLEWVYRCYNCARLITKIEILEARDARRANLCPCGSKAVRTTKAKLWEEFLLPRCWRLIFGIYTKRLAPPPVPLPQEERVMRDKVGQEKSRAFDRALSHQMRKKGAI